jgi:Fe(3+) dicitrate transport protein
MKRATSALLFVVLVLGLAGHAAAQDSWPKPGEKKPAVPTGEKGEGLEQAVDEYIAESGSDVVRLPEVMVIGRRREEGVPTVPLGHVGSRDVFGPDEVRSTGARDMNDLVQNMPAVSTRPYNGGEAAAPSFSMRGLPDDGLTEYILVLIDGVPASPMPYGWTAFSFLPITIDRVFAIDYHRGAFSLRYSPNTVGGVVNLVTRPIPITPTVEMRATFGNKGYASYLVSAGGTHKKLGAIVTYVNRSGDGYRKLGFFDQQEFNLKLRYDIAENQWLAGSISYMDNDHQAPGGLTLEQFDRDRFANARPDNNFSGSRSVIDVVYHHDMPAGGWYEVFGNYADTYRNLYAQRPHFGEAETFSDWKDTTRFLSIGVRGEKTWEIFGVDNTFFAGIRYHGEWLPKWTIDSTPVGGGPTTRTLESSFEYQTLSFHVDDTFSPVENLEVQLGFRVEWIPTAEGEDDVVGVDYSDSFTKFLPGIGVSYLVTPEWSFFGNYFEGFRAPQAWGFSYAKTDGDLELEEGRTFELGTRVKALAGLTGSLAYWRITFDNFGVFYTDYYENLGKIQSDGFDLILDWHVGDVVESLDGLRLYAAVTRQDSTLESGPNKGNQVPYAWDWKANWRISYSFLDGWFATLGGTYIGESYSDTANTKEESADGQIGLNKAYTIWDGRVGKAFELGSAANLDLALGATNLFDNEYSVHSRGGFFGGGKVAGAPFQWYFSAGLNVTW